MVKSIFKRMMLFYIALALVATPMELLAASKRSSSQKTQKRTHSSPKVSASKNRIATRYQVKSARHGMQKINVKLRVARHVISAPVVQTYIDDEYDGSGALQLSSAKALIINQETGETVYAKDTNSASPVASITKLMTAMVILDAKLAMDEEIYISDEDVDYLKGTRSRLSVGTPLSRAEMLQLALMASENRAASALASNYPGGSYAFVKAMNVKARAIGLINTHFVDPTGLDSENVSTAEDLAKMVQAAYQYPAIRKATTTASHEVYLEGRGDFVNFNNTNALVRGGEWDIGLSKTGFINEAGRCLVMQAIIAGEPMIIVLLDSYGKSSRIGDANRIRKWVEYNSEPKETTTGQAPVLTKPAASASPSATPSVVAGRIS
jgi:serine-type D-Ala-D-Ala endopeptidase (penicillin-binding protein 7)